MQSNEMNGPPTPFPNLILDLGGAFTESRNDEQSRRRFPLSDCLAWSSAQQSQVRYLHSRATLRAGAGSGAVLVGWLITGIGMLGLCPGLLLLKQTGSPSWAAFTAMPAPALVLMWDLTPHGVIG